MFCTQTQVTQLFESNYHLQFFLLLSPFLSQTQAPGEAVSAGLQISLEGVLNCRFQGVQQGKPSSLLLLVCISPVLLV